MFKTRKALVVAAVALAASFGAHAAPNAAEATAASDVAPPHGSPHGHWGGPGHPDGPHGPHGAGPMGQPGGPWLAHVLQRLHDQLKLTPAQEQAWNQARMNTQHNFMAMHANHDEMRKQMEAAAQQPILDLSALQATHAQNAAREQTLRADTEQNWITFYNSLSDPQKTLVSTEIKQQWQRMMHHRPHDGRPMPGGPEHDPHKHGGPQGGPPDGPPPGDAPPPQPAD
ncbi:periplasmic heavy metal sensor [Robbsia sp. Bb-Pol-6]|uniref:Periplasmic heavy metal sensor n=1 Tax=Robbsia betulipollinis TaxID=2981849 RepID=A0ABT3ZM49_9BURK|nr:periplasmic heavy metal sensor [Robbsia betulipollinis]MCY0387611.1 periplasmic heavy metal sensor [Robbsia betulipollinis]